MKSWIWLVIVLLSSEGLRAQETRVPTDRALQVNGTYTCDHLVNFGGGIKAGYGYLGMANLQLGLDIEKAGLWNGGSVFVNAVNTHGDTPSAGLLGDAQVASNIEAGNHTFFQELWFKQRLGRVEVTAGLQDMNAEFAQSEYAALFLNSSFGVVPVISGNISSPIFPLTSPGITIKWSFSPQFTWTMAVYDGCPTGFEKNPYNLKWEFVPGDGLLAIGEIGYSTGKKQLRGTYRAGLLTHTHLLENGLRMEFPDSLNRAVYIAYACLDQVVVKHGERSLALFGQAGWCPSGSSVYSTYLGFGLHFTGWFSDDREDMLGLGVAHAAFRAPGGSETAIEVTWQRTISGNIYVQPDFQYIIHPSGTAGNLLNCFTGIVRVGLSL